MDALDRIRMEAEYPYLLRIKERESELWRNIGKSVAAGKPVLLGHYMGQPVWITPTQPPETEE